MIEEFSAFKSAQKKTAGLPPAVVVAPRLGIEPF
jgi:hypothetical protein